MHEVLLNLTRLPVSGNSRAQSRRSRGQRVCRSCPKRSKPATSSTSARCVSRIRRLCTILLDGSKLFLRQFVDASPEHPRLIRERTGCQVRSGRAPVRRRAEEAWRRCEGRSAAIAATTDDVECARPFTVPSAFSSLSISLFRSFRTHLAFLQTCSSH